jgi:hypothetical protein
MSPSCSWRTSPDTYWALLGVTPHDTRSAGNLASPAAYRHDHQHVRGVLTHGACTVGRHAIIGEHYVVVSSIPAPI